MDEKLRPALAAGLAYLAREQLPHGEFRTLLAPGRELVGDDYIWMNSDETAHDSSPFVTSLIIHSIQFMADPRVAAITQRGANFLRSEMAFGGLWRYYSPRDFKYWRIPPDADDTACASHVLYRHGDQISDNRWVFLHNRDKAGRFYTWFLPRRSLFSNLRYRFCRIMDERLLPPNVPEMGADLIGTKRFRKPFDPVPPADVDPVVNANVALFLGEGPDTEGAIEYVRSVVDGGNIDQHMIYYRDPVTLYYMVARAYSGGVKSFGALRQVVVSEIEKRQDNEGSLGSALLTALAMTALLVFEGSPSAIRIGIKSLLSAQHAEGNWPRYAFYESEHECWGSEELTTSLCLEAIARYAAMSETTGKAGAPVDLY